MPIDSDNNKNDAIKKFVADFLEKLKTEKAITISRKEILEKQRKFNRAGYEVVHLEVINLGIKRLKNIQFKAIDNINSVRKLKEAEAFFSNAHYASKHFKCTENFKFSYCTSKIDPYFLVYADIEIQLDALFDKANDLFRKEFNSEGNKLHELIFDFKKINYAYFKTNEITYEDYKFRALSIIDEARQIIKQNRGYKALLGNILVLILTLGTALIINKAISGHFLFFQKVNNSEQLDKLNQTLSQLSL